MYINKLWIFKRYWTPQIAKDETFFLHNSRQFQFLDLTNKKVDEVLRLFSYFIHFSPKKEWQTKPIQSSCSWIFSFHKLFLTCNYQCLPLDTTFSILYSAWREGRSAALTAKLSISRKNVITSGFNNCDFS